MRFESSSDSVMSGAIAQQLHRRDAATQQRRLLGGGGAQRLVVPKQERRGARRRLPQAVRARHERRRLDLEPRVRQRLDRLDQHRLQRGGARAAGLDAQHALVVGEAHQRARRPLLAAAAAAAAARVARARLGAKAGHQAVGEERVDARDARHARHQPPEEARRHVRRKRPVAPDRRRDAARQRQQLVAGRRRQQQRHDEARVGLAARRRATNLRAGAHAVHEVEILEQRQQVAVQRRREARRLPDVRQRRHRQHAAARKLLLGRHNGRERVGEPLRVQHHDVVQTGAGVVEEEQRAERVQHVGGALHVVERRQQRVAPRAAPEQHHRRRRRQPRVGRQLAVGGQRHVVVEAAAAANRHPVQIVAVVVIVVAGHRGGGHRQRRRGRHGERGQHAAGVAGSAALRDVEARIGSDAALRAEARPLAPIDHRRHARGAQLYKRRVERHHCRRQRAADDRRARRHRLDLRAQLRNAETGGGRDGRVREDAREPLLVLVVQVVENGVDAPVSALRIVEVRADQHHGRVGPDVRRNRLEPVLHRRGRLGLAQVEAHEKNRVRRHEKLVRRAVQVLAGKVPHMALQRAAFARTTARRQVVERNRLDRNAVGRQQPLRIFAEPEQLAELGRRRVVARRQHSADTVAGATTVATTTTTIVVVVVAIVVILAVGRIGRRDVSDGGARQCACHAGFADILAADEEQLDAETAERGGVLIGEEAADGGNAARDDGGRRNEERAGVERERLELGEGVERGGESDEIGGGEVEVGEGGAAREFGREAENAVAGEVEDLERGAEGDLAGERGERIAGGGEGDEVAPGGEGAGRNEANAVVGEVEGAELAALEEGVGERVEGVVVEGERGEGTAQPGTEGSGKRAELVVVEKKLDDAVKRADFIGKIS
jgi:hypothetical protein